MVFATGMTTGTIDWVPTVCLAFYRRYSHNVARWVIIIFLLPVRKQRLRKVKELAQSVSICAVVCQGSKSFLSDSSVLFLSTTLYLKEQVRAENC